MSIPFRTSNSNVVQMLPFPIVGETYRVQFDVQEKNVTKSKDYLSLLDDCWTLMTFFGGKGGCVGRRTIRVTYGRPDHPSSIFGRDAADLSEKEFTYLLSLISDLGELQGFANRRKVLNAPWLQKYKPWQRELIIHRKWELEHG